METQATSRTLRVRPPFCKKAEPLRPVKEKAKLRGGHWRKSEQVKYIKFLRKYYFIMKSELLRYHYKIFTKMSEEIGTRTAVQCKSHHQKVLKKVNLQLEKLIFSECDLNGPIIVGQGEQGNHFEVVKNGLNKVETTQEHPYYICQTEGRIVMIIDDRYIDSF